MKSKLVQNSEKLLSEIAIKNLLPDSRYENEIHATAQKLALPLWQELYAPGAPTPDPRDELIATKIFWLGQSDSSFCTRHGKVFDFSKSNSDFLGFSARFRESKSPLVSSLKEFIEKHQQVRIDFFKQQVDEDSFTRSLLYPKSFDVLRTWQEWENWKTSRSKSDSTKNVAFIDQRSDRALAVGTGDGFFEIRQPYQGHYDFFGVYGRINNTMEVRQSHGHEEAEMPCVEGFWEFLVYSTIREFLKFSEE